MKYALALSSLLALCGNAWAQGKTYTEQNQLEKEYTICVGHNIMLLDDGVTAAETIAGVAENECRDYMYRFLMSEPKFQAANKKQGFDIVRQYLDRKDYSVGDAGNIRKVLKLRKRKASWDYARWKEYVALVNLEYVLHKSEREQEAKAKK